MREERITQAKAGKETRFWEVDAARGVAILMMVLYHFMYDLDTFGGYNIESTSGFWARFADMTAFSFVFLVGVSLAISYARSSARSERPLLGKYLWRGARIFGYGMVLTLATWVLGMGVIIFGILHLIGASIILAYPFLQFRWRNLFAGVFFIAAGWYLQTLNISTETPWLLPLGVVPEGLFMPDYRPLLPWFGVVLLGAFAGSLVYSENKRVGGVAWSTPATARPLMFLGRYSLFIYFIHQPILVGLLAASGIVGLGAL